MKTGANLVVSGYLTVAILSSVACNKVDSLNSQDLSSADVEVLEEKRLLGNEIYLPIGTRWNFTNVEHSSVSFDLPAGYVFLMINVKTNESKLAKEGGGYSCTAGGSCTTFYNQDLGYGCLQSTCTGSCIGKKTKTNSDWLIEGVLLAENDLIDMHSPPNPASLSAVGLKGFFKIPEVEKEIKRTYDIIYKHIPRPNFDTLDFAGKEENSKYVFAKTYLYGVQIGLVVPNDPAIKTLMPNLQVLNLAEAPKNCTCSGGDVAGGCKLKKSGIFGYVAYYCTGCTTCTMN
ncbi:MAG: hypothetical protein ACKOWL_02395 [Sphingobacteriaceae bacterium]